MTDPRGISGALVPLSVADTSRRARCRRAATRFRARAAPRSLADDPIDAFWDPAEPVPLTDAGKKATEGFDGSSADNPRLRCEPTNILFDWTFDARVNRIVQDEDADRVAVRLDGHRAHDPSEHDRASGRIEPSVAGHSIGRWEGDVLIVDTVGFAPGVLSADGHDAQRRTARRRALLARPRERRACARVRCSGSAVFHGRIQGCGHASTWPTSRTKPTRCDDRSYVTGRRQTASPAETAARPAGRSRPRHPAPAKPWWKFW